jgi:hypothetical protein
MVAYVNNKYYPDKADLKIAKKKKNELQSAENTNLDG